MSRFNHIKIKIIKTLDKIHERYYSLYQSHLDSIHLN